MSNSENDKLYEQFAEECESFNGCPYCGNPKEEGDACCREVHDETLYEHEALSYTFNDDDFEDAFRQWLKQGEEV